MLPGFLENVVFWKVRRLLAFVPSGKSNFSLKPSLGLRYNDADRGKPSED